MIDKKARLKIGIMLIMLVIGLILVGSIFAGEDELRAEREELVNSLGEFSYLVNSSLNVVRVEKSG